MKTTELFEKRVGKRTYVEELYRGIESSFFATQNPDQGIQEIFMDYIGIPVDLITFIVLGLFLTHKLIHHI